jgi:ABC-type nitrate/sulfonate/bicarbonate transport system substrate-binding protein
MNTPETNAAERMAYSQEYMVPTEVARRLERERDKAREDAINYYAKIGELIEERDDALSQIVQAECRAERFCQERDEARELACVYQHQYYIHVHPNATVPYFSWENGQNK